MSRLEVGVERAWHKARARPTRVTRRVLYCLANISFIMSLSTSVVSDALSRNRRIALALDDRMHLERHIDGRRNILALLLHHRGGQREARLIVLAVRIEYLEVRIVGFFPVAE